MAIFASQISTACRPLSTAHGATKHRASAPAIRARSIARSVRERRQRGSQPPVARASLSLADGTAAASTAPVEQFDFLVLGSGIAGLTYALKVAEHGRVAVVTKGPAAEGATRYAQGGVCAVLDRNDSVEAHIRDTMIAGAFLNDIRAVDAVCREGPSAVLELARLGANFTKTNGGDLHLTREGGHSARRVVHAADATGAEIERALLAAAEAHPSIVIFEHQLAVDLVIGESPDGTPLALGADVLCSATQTMRRFLAPVTMLATGGAGQVYPLTTNPSVATGDGVAMAHRARAAVANMEFVQFHPTAFYNPAGVCTSGGRAFLISEAVRGEGGRLLTPSGERFMPRYDSRAELAPRDVVARAIHSEMEAGGAPHVLLDISHRPSAEVLAHFPTIAAHCATTGVDITQDPIPVVPAQHYMCGGVQAGLRAETTLPGLFACGEAACSGLHGANRLASNSLLEGLVFAARAVDASVAHAEWVASRASFALHSAAAEATFEGPLAPRPLSAAASAWVAAKRRELTRCMWDGAGIVRSQAGMKRALASVAELYSETRALFETYGANAEVIELRNLVTVGELVLSSALQRRESRGGHYCVDFPEAVPQEARATVISTSIRRKSLDLSKSGPSKTTSGAAGDGYGLAAGQAFGGSVNAPGSPKRGQRGNSRELSLTRSAEE